MLEALTNGTPLDYPLHLKPGHSRQQTLRTVGDAALFLFKLPKTKANDLHWSLTRACLSAATRHPANSDLVATATRAMKNALATDGMLAHHAP